MVTSVNPPGRTPGGSTSLDWAPPAGGPTRRSRLRRTLTYGGVLLAVGLLLLGVQLAGGFGRRTDLLMPTEPGALIATGPYELSFTEATVQSFAGTDGRRTKWQLVVLGRARTTGDEALAPTAYGSDSVFVLRDLRGGPVHVPDGVSIGDDPAGLSFYSRWTLTPGLPPTGYRLTFDLPPDGEAPTTVRLGVADLVHESQYLLDDQEKTWDGNGSWWVVELPVRVLPEFG